MQYLGETKKMIWISQVRHGCTYSAISAGNRCQPCHLSLNEE